MSPRKTDPGLSSFTPEELWGPKFKPDPPKQPKGIWKLVRAAFIGLAAGIVVCIVTNSGGYFLPVFGGVTLLLWIGSMGKSK